MPTTQFSRRCTRMRRKVPALCGISGSMLLRTPVMQLFMAQVRDSFTPAGTQSMLSVRSMSIIAASGSMLTVTLMGIPSGSGPRGIVAAMPGDGACRHLRDDVRHRPLGVVEPLLDELLHRAPRRTWRSGP